MSFETEEMKAETVVELSLGEINDLSIDDLLTYRNQNVKIKLKSTDKFNIRWKDNELDVDPQLADSIIDAINAINLQQEIKADVYKQYKSTFTKISKFNNDHKSLTKDLFNISIDADQASISDEDISKFNMSLFNVDPRLDTLNGKVDYIIEKLNIKDITDVMFLVLALVVSEKS